MSVNEKIDKINEEIELNKKKLLEENLTEDEKTFVLLHTGMVYHNAINVLERTLMEMQKIVQSLVPETPDVLKILLARLEDIDPASIDKLSAGFIANTFTINGKELKITIPEVGEIDDLEYKRFVIKQIKICDEQAAVAVEYLKEVKSHYESDIPEYVKELLSDIEKADKWVMEFFKKKAEDPDTDPYIRNEYEKKLIYKEYGTSLKPIIDDIKKQIEKVGNPDSILTGFFIQNERVLEAAISVASKKDFSFPFQMLNGLDHKLLGEDTYDVKYRNLIIYLIARYIKYRAETINEYDKVFFTTLFTNMITLNRPDGIKKHPELAKKLKASIGECMELIIAK